MKLINKEMVMLRFFILIMAIIGVQLNATSETFSKSPNTTLGGFPSITPSNRISLPRYSKHTKIRRFSITDINVSKPPSKFRCDGYTGDTIRFDVIFSSVPKASQKVILRLIQNHTGKSFDFTMQSVSSVHYRYEAVLDRSEKVWDIRLGLANIDTKRVKTIARKRLRLCTKSKQTNVNITKLHAFDKSIGVVNITPKLNKLFSVHTLGASPYHITRWPDSVYATIVFEENETILGFIDSDAKQIRWSSGMISDFEPDYIIKLFPKQNIYLLIHVEQDESQAAVYEANRQTLIKFPGYLRALEDIDQDGIPEVVVQELDDNHTVRLIKITREEGKMHIVPLAKHPHPDRSNDGAFQFDILDNHLYLHPIEWIPKENMVIIKPIKQFDYTDKKSAQRALSRYFTHWSKENIVYKQSMKKGLKYRQLKDYRTQFEISDIDKIRIEGSGDPYGGCLDTYSHYNQKKGIPKLESIVLCKRGKGVVRCQNGVLFIFGIDTDAFHFVSLGGGRYAVATNNYLILTDNKNKQTVYWRWTELIGFQPLAVKYFDAKTIVLAKEVQTHTSLEVYRLTFEKEKKAVEQW